MGVTLASKLNLGADFFGGDFEEQSSRVHSARSASGSLTSHFTLLFSAAALKTNFIVGMM
jgi:hypothetical protein